MTSFSILWVLSPYHFDVCVESVGFVLFRCRVVDLMDITLPQKIDHPGDFSFIKEIRRLT